MIDFTPDHDALRNLAEKFVQEEINPHANEWERDRQLPTRSLFKRMGELGLLGINKPPEFGGLGLDYSYQAVLAESLGLLTSAGVALAIGVQTDMATPALARYGSDELRDEFLRPAICGEQIAALGVSEATGGSDVSAIKTWARRDGDDYVINGSKMWMTNGCQADWICALVNTRAIDPKQSVRIPLDKSLIIIPTDRPGFSIGRKLEKLGMHCSDTAQVFFDDVRVPSRFLIGGEGRGFPYQMKQFCDERLSISLSTIASMHDTLRRTIDYTSSRPVFGGTILSNQAVQFRLSELHADVEVLRAFAWRTVEQFVAGRDVGQETAILKLKTGRLVRRVNDQCLQLWGGMGYMDETVVAQRYRDQRLISIGGGPDEVMLQIISNTLGLDRMATSKSGK
jgi:citronellyl-CoA dehydrogenase